ncbi:MAG: UDP-N-acetylmuramyl-tripeptide synthetase [Bacillota bacterium]|nr:UDP-N-acetylmuramyl-tripeptide synthetase [Bacillota bacterium]
MNKLSLSEYIDLLKKEELLVSAAVRPLDSPRPVMNLSCDSQEEQEEGAFVCKGAHFNVKYLQEALAKGAFCYIAEEPYELDEDEVCSYVIVNDIRRAMTLLTERFYGPVWQQLQTMALVGTKGKSTTCYYLRHIMDDYMAALKAPPSAILSSIDTYDGVENRESHITTPEVMALYRHFQNALDSGIQFFELEVSSQALKYGRIGSVVFNVACFLNISEDHISDIEHPDFDDYFSSKLRIFNHCKTACINLSTEHLEEVMDRARLCGPDILTFGTDERAAIYGHHIHKEGEQVVFTCTTPRWEKVFRLGMPGFFNVDNALAAIAACYALNIPTEHIYNGLLKARVPGRMEYFVDENTGASVLVDYVHTRLAYETLCSSLLREFPGKKIVVIVGGAGYKAYNRRRDHAEVISRYAVKCVLTEEDPGEEPTIDICEDIARYLRQYGCPYEIILNRGEAIRRTMEEADKDTIIVVAGKGREKWYKLGTEYVPCKSDVEYVEEFCRLRK